MKIYGKGDGTFLGTKDTAISDYNITSGATDGESITGGGDTNNGNLASWVLCFLLLRPFYSWSSDRLPLLFR